LLVSDAQVFLEVQRFDRIGLTGRVGMLSAVAVDAEFFGKRESWPEFAARCEQAKCLSPEDAPHVDTMAAFSEMIGSSDRRFENISLLIGEDSEYQGIAPAYDILPISYASIGGRWTRTSHPSSPRWSASAPDQRCGGGPLRLRSPTGRRRKAKTWARWCRMPRGGACWQELGEGASVCGAVVAAFRRLWPAQSLRDPNIFRLHLGFLLRLALNFEKAISTCRWTSRLSGGAWLMLGAMFV
jgi:hypothetical protein